MVIILKWLNLNEDTCKTHLYIYSYNKAMSRLENRYILILNKYLY